MDATKRQRLEAKGWKVGTVAEFLEETPAQSAYIEMKLTLAARLRATRLDLGLSQAEAARRLKTKQPNVARMELGADRSVTVDLLVRALLELGVTPAAIAAVLAIADNSDETATASVGAGVNTAKRAVPRRQLRRPRVATRSEALATAGRSG